MKPKVMFETPRNSGEASNLLKHLKLNVPDRDGFLAISETEGPRFARALCQLANQEGDTEVCEDYVRNVLCASSPETRELLVSAAGIDVPLTTLISVAVNEGRSFREAMRLLGQADNKDRQMEAAAHLSELIEQYSDGLIFDSGYVRDGSHRQAAVENAFPLPEREAVRTESPVGSGRRQGASPQCQHSLPPSPRKSEKPFGESYHVYGGNYALCFSEAATRKPGKHTVIVEAAKTPGRGEVPMWDEKISVSLTIAELPLVLGALYGYAKNVQLKGHGANNEKTLSFERQEGRLYVSLQSFPEKPWGVPIPAHECYPLISMLLRQMLKNDPHLTPALILAMTQQICSWRGDGK